MPDVQEQISQAKDRVRALTAARDEVIRDAGIEEQKLQQVYDSLRQLGIADPDKLSDTELAALASKTESELGETLARLGESLTRGEALLAEYEALQKSQ